MSRVLPLSGKATTPPAAAPLNSVAEMLSELRAGRMVIVMDDEDRENEGDLIMAAEHATSEAVAFGLSAAQLFSLLLMAIGACGLVAQRGRAPEARPGVAPAPR